MNKCPRLQCLFRLSILCFLGTSCSFFGVSFAPFCHIFQVVTDNSECIRQRQPRSMLLRDYWFLPANFGTFNVFNISLRFRSSFVEIRSSLFMRNCADVFVLLLYRSSRDWLFSGSSGSERQSQLADQYQCLCNLCCPYLLSVVRATL